MGMFDTIWLPEEARFQCPRGHRIESAQTKDLQCSLDDYEFRDGELHPRDDAPTLSGERAIEIGATCAVCKADESASNAVRFGWHVWFLVLDGMKVKEMVRNPTHPLLALIR